MSSSDPAFSAVFDCYSRSFCMLCKKDISDTVKVIACVDRQRQTYLNFCPSCLVRDNNPFSIVEYVVCDKIPEQIPFFGNIPRADILSTLQQAQKNGIESVSYNPQCPAACKTYEKLNKQVFSKHELEISTEDKSYNPQRFTPIKKPNVQNKKILETLGYNWERKQFGYLPEALYQHMIGAYDEEQALDDDGLRVMKVLTHKYQQQQEQFAKTQEHLLKSNYLQPKKRLQLTDKVPKQIAKLVEMEGPVNELMSCATTFLMKNRKPRQLTLFNKWAKDTKQRKKRKREQRQKLMIAQNKNEDEPQLVAQEYKQSEKQSTPLQSADEFIYKQSGKGGKNGGWIKIQKDPDYLLPDRQNASIGGKKKQKMLKIDEKVKQKLRSSQCE